MTLHSYNYYQHLKLQCFWEQLDQNKQSCMILVSSSIFVSRCLERDFFCYSSVAKCFTPSLHKFTAYVLHKSLSGYMFDFILKNKIPATAKLPISLLLLVVEVWN